MKQMTLNTLYQDRKRFEAMLQQEQVKLADAQTAILRIEGVLIYINQNITFMEKPPEEK